MKFNLIDKVELLAPERIVAVKFVSLAEEYLADHFPTFPVLPGVLMLEAATQSAAWLLHHRWDFARSMAVLREARNVKYGQFVAPGSYLRIDVQAIKLHEAGGSFKASGTVATSAAGPGHGRQTDSTGSRQAVQMRLELSYFDLAGKNPQLAETDARLREHNRRRWELIRPTAASSNELPVPATAVTAN